MRLQLALPTAFALLVSASCSCAGVAPAQDGFGNLPPGWAVTRSFVVPAVQTAAISTKLGAPITRLSNTFLQTPGGAIQVNVIRCATAEGAAIIHETVSAMKGGPEFCLLDGNTVVEFANTSASLATVAAFELGFVPKPESARYRLDARVALVRKVDYLKLNELSLLLGEAAGGGPEQTMAAKRARELATGFEFGSDLLLRNPLEEKAFTPPVAQEKPVDGAGVARYSFTNAPELIGVPYVWVKATIAVRSDGRSSARGIDLTRCLEDTLHWPSTDPQIVKLASSITRNAHTDAQKVDAILTWLRPGSNVRFGGPITGSRYGTKKVLEQRFGQCWDFSDLFITLGRAAGVPCRQTAGWLYGVSGHVWAEFLDGDAWQQVDPTGGPGSRCGLYHVPWFTSEDGDMPILYIGMPGVSMICD